MSVREADPTAPAHLNVTGREVAIGKYTTVRRFLPDRARRTIGAWCFVDHFGPEDLTRPNGAGHVGMWVPPHPHTGLQTVTWLYAGEVLHRDSVGSLQSIRPGQLNVMTSGHGIAHSEESVPGGGPVMHGLQLWVALPPGQRATAARFEHRPDLPLMSEGPVRATVLVGSLGGSVSPAEVHSPLMAVDIEMSAGAVTDLPLETDFEYGVLAVSGRVAAGDTTLTGGTLQYRRPGERHLRLRALDASRVFVLGGTPYEDPLVMWWNFVGGDHDEIVAARADWEAGVRFGTVEGFPGDPLPAPALPGVRLVPRYRDGSR